MRRSAAAEPPGLAALCKNAKAGDVQAQTTLGLYYFCASLHYGVKPRRATGLRWLEKAAASGQPRAVTRLAEALLDYRPGTDSSLQRHRERGKQLLLDMARQEEPEALLSLAVQLDTGKHFPRDRSEALRLIERSAALGNKRAKIATEKLEANPDWKITQFELATTLGQRQRQSIPRKSVATPNSKC